MDLQKPLRSVFRSIDADLLDTLLSSHLSHTGSALARMTGRSKSHVWSVLQRLQSEGLVLRSDDEGGSWWSANDTSPVIAWLRTPRLLADAVADTIASELSSWTSTPIGAAIAPPSWAARLGCESLIVVVHPQPDSSDVSRFSARITRMFGEGAQVLVGPYRDVAEQLSDANIPWWDDARRARTLMGANIVSVLCGTGGI